MPWRRKRQRDGGEGESEIEGIRARKPFRSFLDLASQRRLTSRPSPYTIGRAMRDRLRIFFFSDASRSPFFYPPLCRSSFVYTLCFLITVSKEDTASLTFRAKSAGIESCCCSSRWYAPYKLFIFPRATQSKDE